MQDIVGKKRTAFEADLDSKISASTERKVMLVKHFREVPHHISVHVQHIWLRASHQHHVQVQIASQANLP